MGGVLRAPPGGPYAFHARRSPASCAPGYRQGPLRIRYQHPCTSGLEDRTAAAVFRQGRQGSKSGTSVLVRVAQLLCVLNYLPSNSVYSVNGRLVAFCCTPDRKHYSYFRAVGMCSSQQFFSVSHPIVSALDTNSWCWNPRLVMKLQRALHSCTRACNLFVL